MKSFWLLLPLAAFAVAGPVEQGMKDQTTKVVDPTHVESRISSNNAVSPITTQSPPTTTSYDFSDVYSYISEADQRLSSFARKSQLSPEPTTIPKTNSTLPVGWSSEDVVEILQSFHLLDGNFFNRLCSLRTTSTANSTHSLVSVSTVTATVTIPAVLPVNERLAQPILPTRLPLESLIAHAKRDTNDTNVTDPLASRIANLPRHNLIFPTTAIPPNLANHTVSHVSATATGCPEHPTFSKCLDNQICIPDPQQVGFEWDPEGQKGICVNLDGPPCGGMTQQECWGRDEYCVPDLRKGCREVWVGGGCEGVCVKRCERFCHRDGWRVMGMG